MFQYFPSNYVWSLSTMIALTHGGNIGEVDAMCRPLLEAARAGDDPGTAAFFAAWQGGAQKLRALADADLARGRRRSAGDKLQRAALYLAIAERMQSQGFDARLAAYRQSLAWFEESRQLTRSRCRRVEVPFGPAPLAGLYVPAEGLQPGERAPLVLVMNGLDSTKELLQMSVMGTQFAQRGLSALFIDQPGTGEALRLHGMPAVHDSERWATPVLEWLLQHLAVDPARIGALGVSLGGYFCPRAVAFEPRFACGAVWGGNHDWRAVQQARLKREGENPVPHYWQHVQWVFGATDLADFLVKAESMHLDGVLHRVRVPFLVTHGAGDRQIPLAWAQRSYDELINSPRRELLVFDENTGGVEHSSLDNPASAGALIADWLAEVLGGTTA